MTPMTDLDLRFAAYRATSQFCFITPTSMLEPYASQSSMHLVLAHLVDTDPAYADFYQNQTQFKIMDNGAFELGESYSPARLIELGHRCKADVIVLPDYPGQRGDKTVQAAIALADEIHAAGFKTMFVPQSEVGDLEGWIESYMWASIDNPLVDVIGMSILGIPNALPKVHPAFARCMMTEILFQRNLFNTNKPHHYLGLNAGPNLEIPTLLSMGALTSCDSSGPVWSAVLGHEYTTNSDSFLATGKPKMHVDFFHPWRQSDDALNKRIQHNMDLTTSLFANVQDRIPTLTVRQG